ncbi:MAG: hypothetical protein WAT71_10190 [Ignavibacteria bacterium]
MKKLILILVILIFNSINVFAVDRHFYSFNGTLPFNAGWNGPMPSAGDNLYIHGGCYIDQTTGIDYGNLYLDDCEHAGSLTFVSGNTLSVNNVIVNTTCAAINLSQSGFLRIRGTLQVAYPSIITQGAGALDFFGGSTMPTNITTFANLRITATSAAVRLRTSITVNGNLILNSFHWGFELREYDLTIGASGTITGSSQTSYIQITSSGKLIRYVDSNEAIFPFGYKGQGYTAYNPVIIKNYGTPDWFTVGLEGNFINTPVPNRTLLREWSIFETVPGGSNATLTFGWDNHTDLNNFNRNNRIAIARYDSSQWMETNSSRVTSTVEPYSTSASGFTSFGYMTIKNKSNFINNVSIIPEGFYDTLSNKLNLKDTLRTYLRNIKPPYNLVDSAITFIDSTTFTARDTFYNAPTGNYYILLKHRSGIETWSKSGGERMAIDSIYNYDFTTSYSQAYGSNQILKGSKYCIYSGDVNQDGAIDLTDMSVIDNDAAVYTPGYNVTDLNGDNIVDLSDMEIANNNSANYVAVVRP